MNLDKTTPLSAAFIRGFMEQARLGNQGLKDCGSAGKAQVEELGMAISNQYISKITRLLAADGYIVKVRQGRHYVVGEGDQWETFFEWLDNTAPEGWGQSNRADQEWPDRLKVINAHRLGIGLRSTAERLIPSTAFRMAQTIFKQGEYEVVFVPAGKRVVLFEKREGKWVKDSVPQVWDKMDHEGIQEKVEQFNE